MSMKTVYILGAGASVSSKLPTQAGILPLLFSINQSSFHDFENDIDFLSLNINDNLHRIQEFYPIFDEYRKSVGDFIIENFASKEQHNQYIHEINYALQIDETDASMTAVKETRFMSAYDIVKSINVSLEDLFTIFDSVGIDREHFRGYSPREMTDIHNKLKLCIIYALSYSIASNSDFTDYKNFSQILIKKRLKESLKEDSMSVITMNWDDILENTLYKLCAEYNSKISPKQIHIYPDLCFYNYDLNKSEKHIPSIHVKAKGHKNIKILKMHGSLAWLECPKCKRIYTDYENEIASEEFSEMKCPYCSTVSDTLDDPPILRSLIITPTFMKSLGNLNLKNIWHNAYIDISEADRIIFIGYSFPDADFEMRCLLKKAVKHDAEIQVVLCESDNPKTYYDDFVSKGYTPEEATKLIKRMWLPAERYRSFFGADNISFFYGGFSNFINDIGEK